MSPPVAPRPVTGASIVADLEELAVAGVLDDVAVQMVRQGLFAIADRIRELPGIDTPDLALNAADRAEVLGLVDPSGDRS